MNKNINNHTKVTEYSYFHSHCTIVAHKCFDFLRHLLVFITRLDRAILAKFNHERVCRFADSIKRNNVWRTQPIKHSCFFVVVCFCESGILLNCNFFSLEQSFVHFPKSIIFSHKNKSMRREGKNEMNSNCDKFQSNNHTTHDRFLCAMRYHRQTVKE